MPSAALSCGLPDGSEEASPPPEPHAPVKNTAAQTMDKSFSVLFFAIINPPDFRLLHNPPESNGLDGAEVVNRYLQSLMNSQEERMDMAQLTLYRPVWSSSLPF